jgi:predicted Zn-dependent protease
MSDRTTPYPRIGALIFAGLIAVGSLTGLSGCAVNPATGEQSLVGFMQPEDEAGYGAQQHPQILKAFGGVYNDPAISRYVDDLGQRLAATSERPDLTFTFTVLDSPVVNAFALPGGYVYVTRGLLELADTEAQLASVIGHEIGHVTALHGAQRMTRGMFAGLGAAILGAAIGDQTASQLLNMGAAAIVQGYSREQEFEADTLGIRYMTRVGYDPRASAEFLEKLRGTSVLRARMNGGRDPDQFDLFASHPRTFKRVQQAAAAAATGSGVVGRGGYLDRIDGLVHGSSPEQGFVRGRDFLHPVLRFAFRVPEGFTLQNSPNAVSATNQAGTAGIIYDQARTRAGSVERHLRYEWAPRQSFQAMDRLTIDGRPAITGLLTVRGQKGPVSIRLVAIQGSGDRIHRFAFITPASLAGRFSGDFKDVAFSFRSLSPQEAAQLEPYRIRIITAGSRDTVRSLAETMPDGPYREERFRLLNGLRDGEDIQAGDRVKIIR